MSDTLKVYPARARAEASGNLRDFATELNPQQAAAATYGDGPLLIIAGAGTGKTRTLVYRVAHLIERGVPAERILLLTFTRRASQEMLSRAERRCSPRRAGRSTPPRIVCSGATDKLPVCRRISPSWTRATRRT